MPTPPGFAFRPYRGPEDHAPMAAVRLGCADRDGVDPHSVVDGLPTAREIAGECASLADPAADQVLVEHEGSVVGYGTVRWWEERDGTHLYLHRGFLLPGHRGRGAGSAMLHWAESGIRRLVQEHGTASTAVFGANAAAGERDSTALLLDAGYQRVFSLVELELEDLRLLPERGAQPPPGIRLGPVRPRDHRAAWQTVVDSYAHSPHTPRWRFEDFTATAEPACWRAAFSGEDVVGVALCAPRRHDPAVGEVEELSVRREYRRLGVGRAVLLAGLRALREHGAASARLYTGSANPFRSYDLYESVGFRRRNEYVRYRRPVDAG